MTALLWLAGFAAYVLMSIAAALALGRLFRNPYAVEDPGHVTGSDQLDS